MWLDAKCPVRPEEQVWTERSMDWLTHQFGADVLRGTVVLPSDDFFPGSYAGTASDVRRVFDLLGDRMAVDPSRVELRIEPDEGDDLRSNVPVQGSWQGAAGHYRRHDGRAVIAIRAAQARHPMALVATIAHELGHERLLGENRLTADQADHEPLTDLLTVFFGLGIFGANAAAEFTRPAGGGWLSQRLGYLTEPMFGYALACYAWRREEPAPSWARYLDTNPRAYLKQGLRFLRSR